MNSRSDHKGGERQQVRRSTGVVMLFVVGVAIVLGGVVVWGALKSLDQQPGPQAFSDNATQTPEVADVVPDQARRDERLIELLSEECDPSECLVQGPESPVGYGRIEGYYEPYKRYPAWSTSDEKVTCHALHVTGGSQQLIDHFLAAVERGNTVQRTTANGDLLLNLPFESMSQSERETVRGSSATDTIMLKVVREDPPGRGVATCWPFVGVYGVLD